jgi:hypothetical protein
MSVLNKLNIILDEVTVAADVDTTPTKDNATLIGMERRHSYDHFRYGKKKFDTLTDALTHIKSNYTKGVFLQGVRKNGAAFERQEVRIKR